MVSTYMKEICVCGLVRVLHGLLLRVRDHEGRRW